MRTLIFLSSFLLSLSLYAQTAFINHGMYVNSDGDSLFISIPGSFIQNSTGKFTLNCLMTINGDIKNEGELVLGNNASLLNHGEIYSMGGTFTIIQNLGDSEKHFVSIPVPSTQANVFQNSIVSAYIEIDNDWIPLNGNYLISPLEGLVVQAFSTDDFVYSSSSLNTGIVGINTLTNQSGSFNLIGNPFTSAANWTVETGWNKSYIENVYYIWNHDEDTYAAFVNGHGTYGATGIIPKGQGFFVKRTGDDYYGSFSVNNDARVHDSGTPFYKKTQCPKLRILAGNDKKDETLIYQTNEATENYDVNLDAEKLFSINRETPQLYTFINDEDIPCCINAIPDNSNYIEIPLHFKTTVSGNFDLQITENTISQYTYLKDLKNNELFDLHNQKNISFEQSSANNENRFLLIFSTEALSIEDLPVSSGGFRFKMYPNPAIDHITLETPVGSLVEITNLLGQVVSINHIETQITKINLSVFSPGIYILTSRYDTCVTTHKLIIKE